MARLKALRSTVAPLKAAINPLPTDGLDIQRDQSREATRSWYSLAKWRRLRWATFVRDGFICQMCGRLEGNPRSLVCDHKRPHRGSERLFWDADNLQTLCKSPCHDKHKQLIERAGGV